MSRPIDLPWMPFYTTDFRNSRRVRRMSLEQIGLYTMMLLDQWDDGPLPDNPDEVAELLQKDPEAVRRSWGAVRPCFDEHDNVIVNTRLEEVRRLSEAHHIRLSRAGKRGAQVTNGKRPSGQADTGPPARPPASPQPGRGKVQPQSHTQSQKETTLAGGKESSSSSGLAGLESIGVRADAAALVRQLRNFTDLVERGIVGQYGPDGTQEAVWRGVPPDERPSLLSSALIRIATERPDGWHGRFFWKVLTGLIQDAAKNSTEQISAAEESKREADRAAEARARKTRTEQQAQQREAEDAQGRESQIWAWLDEQTEQLRGEIKTKAVKLAESDGWKTQIPDNLARGYMLQAAELAMHQEAPA